MAEQSPRAFDTRRVAKKEHLCFFCEQPITRGTVYVSEWVWASWEPDRVHVGCAWLWVASNEVLRDQPKTYALAEDLLRGVGPDELERVLGWTGKTLFGESLSNLPPAELERAQREAGSLAVRPREEDAGR